MAEKEGNGMNSGAVNPNLYTVGGTVQANEGGLYIERQADEELLALCEDSKYAYVLTPRQMGKSSLMIRTAERLIDDGRQAVIVDLTQLGTQLSADEWYSDFLDLVASQLMLATDVKRWWRENGESGLALRLTRFFQEVVLAEVAEPVVVFVDEIDTTLSLDFTDDFYAAIRYLYVARSTDSRLRRLSFVLIGVATPADLIRDPKRTPFNIGQRVDLTDFTAREALPLAAGLGLAAEKEEQILDGVLAWTGGHPYLTQRLCRALVEQTLGEHPLDGWTAEAVEPVVAETFLGRMSEQDNNLQFVRDMLTKRSPQGLEQEVLTTYREIYRDRQPVLDEEQSLVKSHLKLSGVVWREGKHLAVRNRIYQEVFGKAWIQEYLPESFWQRYRPVLKWAIPTTAAIIAIPSAIIMAGLLYFAIEEAAEAREQRAIAAEQKMIAESNAEEAKKQELLAQRNAEEARAFAEEAEKQRLLAQRNAEEARDSEKKIQQALASEQLANQQRAVALRAEQTQRERAEQQTRLAEQQTRLAEQQAFRADTLERATRVLNWLPTENATPALMLSIDTMLQSQQSPELRSKAYSSLLSAVQVAREVNLLRGHRASVFSVAFSPDGQRVVSGSRDGTMRLWDTQTGNPIGEPLEGHTDSVLSVAFSPDGQLVISGSSDRTIRVWSSQTQAPIGDPMEGHRDIVLVVAFSPDGQRVVSGSGDGTVRLWDAQTGAQIGDPLQGYGGSVNSVALSPDSRHVVSGSDDQTVRLWDVETGQPVGSPMTGHRDRVLSVAFSPDGRYIVSGSEDNTLRIWDAPVGNIASNLFLGHSSLVTATAFSPDGQILASSSSDQTVKLWDLSGNELATLQGHYAGVNSVSFSPNGQILASGGDDGTVRLWDRSGQLFATLEGHTAGVRSVSFSPDGLTIASAGSDGTVRLWDRNGQELATPAIQETPVTAVAFSPDGQFLASGSSDAGLSLVSLNLENLIMQACARLEFHPFLKDPETVPPEFIQLADRSRRACQQHDLGSSTDSDQASKNWLGNVIHHLTRAFGR